MAQANPPPRHFSDSRPISGFSPAEEPGIGCVFVAPARRGFLKRGQHLRKVVLFCNPLHPYATRFIAVIADQFGYEPICIHTTPRRGRRYPGLERLEHRFVPAEHLRDFAAALAREREVAGAIPFTEAVLGDTIELLRGLNSSWNDESTLALLRDKFALKEQPRRVRPTLRVGASQRVDILAPFELDDAPERFVLKPNQGYGNSSVGFFTRSTPVEDIRAFIKTAPAGGMVLEEFLAGSEYFVNGQIDHQGRAIAVAAFRYERIEANGHLVDWLTHQVSHSAPEFAALEAYAQRVATGLNLRRSPFHLEARLKDGEPSLVEIGARLAGNGNAFVCNELHGNKLDVFRLAADHYLHDGPRAEPPLDWHSYERSAITYVHGVSFEDSFIHSLEGVAELERHPQFAGWVKRPEIGQRLRPTVDFFTSPWAFLSRAPARRDELRSFLQVNHRPGSWRLPYLRGKDLARRAAGRLARWSVP